MTAPPQLTQADAEALEQIPADHWVEPAFLMIRRSWYRCALLERAVVLERQGIDRH